MSFGLFVLRHRFRLRDIFSSASETLTLQEVELSKFFIGDLLLRWHFGRGSLAQLNRALGVAEYMSSSSIDRPEDLSFNASKLSDEAWAFALRFAPYHKVHVALENLGRVHAAMLEACINLNSAMAGMDSAFELNDADRSVYIRERSRATSSLLTFVALYSSYIDVCYRVRNYCGLTDRNTHSRAVRRIIGKNIGAHSFAKELRHFMLHYHLVEPEMEVSYGAVRSTRLVLRADALLFSGFLWKSDARDFIRSNGNLDVVETTRLIVRDVARVVRFHRKMAEGFLCGDKFAYDVYLLERARFRHTRSASINIGAAFGIPSSLLSRVLPVGFLDEALHSALGDDELQSIICSLADRHGNLSAEAKANIRREIDETLAARPRFPNVGAFLDGRKLPQ